jgi:hypothetical protein
MAQVGQPRKRPAASQILGLGSAALLRRGAQPFSDGLDRMAPIVVRLRLQAEGAHGVGWNAAVTEEPGTRLTGYAERLMPLQGIDVFGGHVIRLQRLSQAKRRGKGRQAHPASKHHYAAPGNVMFEGLPSRN